MKLTNPLVEALGGVALRTIEPTSAKQFRLGISLFHLNEGTKFNSPKVLQSRFSIFRQELRSEHRPNSGLYSVTPSDIVSARPNYRLPNMP